MYDTACKGIGGNNLLHCINSSTYGLDDIIITDENVENDGYFTTDITYANEGQCHTYRAKDKIGSQVLGMQLPLLNKYLDYRIFIHDPDFFFVTINPKAFPGFKIFL